MARRVLTQAQRYLRDTYKLGDWLSKNAARCRLYFRCCDRVIEQLRELMPEEDPPDKAVVASVFAMLREDGTFTDHVAKSQGATLLTDDEGWDNVTMAASAQIYHEYLVAVEKKEWPEL